jgi:AraC family transcriptional regulator
MEGQRSFGVPDMRLGRLPRAESVVGRLLGMPPPVIPIDFAGGTKVTPRWSNPPFEGHLPGFKEHVVVAHLGGHSRASVRTDGRLHAAATVPGTVSVCPRGHDTARRSDGTIEVVSLFLDPDRLRSCSDQVGRGQEPEVLDRLGFQDPKLFAVLRLIGQEVPLSATPSRLFVDHLIDLLCLQLLRAHTSFPAPTASRPSRGLAPWQVKRVTAYMRDHFADDIGLQELADIVRLSRFHFCSAFRMATGRTPYEWLTRHRMDIARKLLADPAMRVTDIALAVGYQTPSAFAASFRRHVGVAPTEFRRGL